MRVFVFLRLCACVCCVRVSAVLTAVRERQRTFVLCLRMCVEPVQSSPLRWHLIISPPPNLLADRVPAMSAEPDSGFLGNTTPEQDAARKELGTVEC